MRLLVIIPFLLTITASATEPSVFGAGDLNSPNPYGLTHEEKLILENKKELQSVIQKNNMQNAKVETVTERLDGMQGILEGLGQRSNEQSIILQKLQDKLSVESNGSVSLDDLSKQVNANTENIAQFKALLEELSHAVDEINMNYVSKEQFAVLIKQLKVSVPERPAASSAKMSNADIEKEANKLFSQKKYDDAQSYFEQMIQKKYKVSDAYFMIGETQFERKKYKEAVLSYKESASRNEKALYMPTLLLHSGISMEKTGDTATAKAFYQATISKFGGSGASKEAQERLSKLK
ncbi:TPR repeat-containing protein [Sulfuricurvum kujiense DSM 16994]|uniref:TPR repeat-containing protein n=1 Tax=Sulfuricurvum kujiense (strain ATCC BAA-921 / DSM 16994 / JCM 11577 / YK-1) TaxID=709032 RepID=E4U1J6_SULKY|nr:tetratricopeptide repeat protein [Sulfuricurvum kujiense]ADR33432.1 TPR repeat-containing protein [Sulfuricurvum kujiense DSM 16994]